MNSAYRRRNPDNDRTLRIVAAGLAVTVLVLLAVLAGLLVQRSRDGEGSTIGQLTASTTTFASDTPVTAEVERLATSTSSPKIDGPSWTVERLSDALPRVSDFVEYSLDVSEDMTYRTHRSDPDEEIACGVLLEPIPGDESLEPILAGMNYGDGGTTQLIVRYVISTDAFELNERTREVYESCGSWTDGGTTRTILEVSDAGPDGGWIALQDVRAANGVTVPTTYGGVAIEDVAVFIAVQSATGYEPELVELTMRVATERLVDASHD